MLRVHPTGYHKRYVREVATACPNQINLDPPNGEAMCHRNKNRLRSRPNTLDKCTTVALHKPRYVKEVCHYFNFVRKGPVRSAQEQICRPDESSSTKLWYWRILSLCNLVWNTNALVREFLKNLCSFENRVGTAKFLLFIIVLKQGNLMGCVKKFSSSQNALCKQELSWEPSVILYKGRDVDGSRSTRLTKGLLSIAYFCLSCTHLVQEMCSRYFRSFMCSYLLLRFDTYELLYQSRHHSAAMQPNNS